MPRPSPSRLQCNATPLLQDKAVRSRHLGGVVTWEGLLSAARGALSFLVWDSCPRRLAWKGRAEMILRHRLECGAEPLHAAVLIETV